MTIFRIESGGFVPPYAGGDPVPPRNGNPGTVPPDIAHPIKTLPMPPGWTGKQPAGDQYQIVVLEPALGDR